MSTLKSNVVTLLNEAEEDLARDAAWQAVLVLHRMTMYSSSFVRLEAVFELRRILTDASNDLDAICGD